MKRLEISLERVQRIPSPSHARKFAYRFTLVINGTLTLRECYARFHAGGWMICGPLRRENGRSVALSHLEPSLRASIVDALEAALKTKREVAV